MKKFSKIAIIVGITAIAFYTLPYLILKQNSVISAWDNLDSYFIWYKVISKYSWFLPLDFKIPEFMNGLSRNVFHSELIFQVAIFNFLTPLKAYIFIDILGRIIAYIGTYLLLKDYVLINNKNEFVLSGLALCFAFIPNLLTLIFLTLLGQPLWLWTFLNIRSGNYRFYNWVILTLIPFCVNFELITPFFLTFVGFIWLYDLITKRKFNLIFLFSICYCAFISLVTIYRYIYITFFDNTFVSHRKDWSIMAIQALSLKPFIQSVQEGIKLHIMDNGEGCCLAMNKIIMLPTSLFAVLYAIIKNLKEKKALIFIWLLMFGIAIFYGLMLHYVPIIQFVDSFEFLKQFQLNRFYFLLPMLWLITFALSLNLIKEQFNKFGKYIVFILIFYQIIYSLGSNFYFKNSIKYMFHKNLPENVYTYKEYFAEKQFSEIKEFIGEPQNRYKVAVLGLLPLNISAYNGFYSINGYFNLFSLDYKKKLNKLNANLLKKNYVYRMLLEFWGHQQIIYWEEKYFDTNIMKELGTKYLMSDRPVIPLEKNSKVKFLKEFKHPESKYTIYLYELIK